MELIATLVGLGWNSILDLKERRISIWFTAIYGIVGLALRLGKGDNLLQIGLSLLPGIFFLGFAKISCQRVGYGDGLIMLAIGCYLPLSNMLYLCMLAIFAAGVVALILCVFFHKGKNYELPFVPFLLISFLFVRCVG